MIGTGGMRCRGAGPASRPTSGPSTPTPSGATSAPTTAKVAPLYTQVTANLHQSRTLATLRDALLPKLLSGELPVVAATA
jgi:hypothetical protein